MPRIKFAASNKRLKAKSVSLTRGYAPGPRWGLRPQVPVMGHYSCIWGVSNSLPPALFVHALRSRFDGLFDAV